MMKIYHCIILLVVAFANADGQNSKLYNLKTTNVLGNGVFGGGLVPANMSDTNILLDIEFIKKNNIKKYIIKQANFQPAQYYYNRFIDGKIQYEFLKPILARFQTDSSELSKNNISQGIKILIAETNDSNKFYIVDANNNSSFYDERMINYETKGLFVKPELIPYSEVDVELFYAHKIQWKKINIKIHPFKTGYKYRDSIENYFYIMVESFEHRTATITLGLNTYVFFISNQKPSLNYSTNNTVFHIYNKNKKKINTKYLNLINDTVSVDGYDFILKEISAFGEEIVIEVNSKKKEFSRGFKENQLASPIYSNDLSGKIVQLQDFKGKYILLDFWGTWCVPCKENIPYLKKMYKKYSAKEFSIVGIASDKDLAIVKKYVDMDEITWVNIFDSFDDPRIIKAFRVEVFPTYLLIDKTGVIVIRTDGKEGLLKIDKYLNKILK